MIKLGEILAFSYVPVTEVIVTEVDPESGSTISSAMHSTLLKQTDGVDFILKDVSEPD